MLFFYKGDNLCDVLSDFLDNETLPRWICFLRKEFAPRGANPRGANSLLLGEQILSLKSEPPLRR